MTALKDRQQDIGWFSLVRQPQEPQGPGGRTLEGEELERWRRQFDPLLSYLRGREVVLALSGGGMALPCHVSVIRVLELLSIRISRIYGTSAGAVIGGLRAAGLGVDDLERAMLGIESPDELFGFGAKYPTLRLLTGAVRRKLLGASLDESGIYDVKTVEGYVERTLRSSIGTVPFMSDLDTWFAAIACDIGTGGSGAADRVRKAIFSKNLTPDLSLTDAIAASMSIPGVFTPKRIGGRFHIDGGPVELVPMISAREDWLERRGRFNRRGLAIIAVDLSYGGETLSEERLSHPIDLAMYSNDLRGRILNQYALLQCHRPRSGTSVILLRPKTIEIGLAEVEKIPLALYTSYFETIRQLAGPGFLDTTNEELSSAREQLCLTQEERRRGWRLFGRSRPAGG